MCLLTKQLHAYCTNIRPRARYYDPGTGRFLQKDPEPGKLDYPGSVVNSHIYVLNNPASWTDPHGKLIWFLAIPLIMTIAGAITGGAWAAITGKNILSGIGMGALGGLIAGIGATGGIAIAGLIAGTGGAAVIGTAAGTLGGGLGSGIASAAWGYSQGGWLGALTGFGFGFAGGAIAGAGTLPFFADLTQSAVISTPPVVQTQDLVPKQPASPQPKLPKPWL